MDKQPKQPKEIDVFNRYDRFEKLKVIGISLLIAVVIITSLYFFVKSLLVYTVTYELNGGHVYGQTLEPAKLRFLQRVDEPANVKKEGYYIEYWSDKKDLSNKYRFGSLIWNSMTLYVNWKEGFAVRLHFAEGEENSDMPTKDLKGYYEQYVKPGEDWTLPLIYNNKEGSLHKGEQLLWYDNPECTGEPFATKEYKNITQSIDIYGKWFDTSANKFQVDSNGTLQKYLGHCSNIILPNNIIKIKDIDPNRFTAESDMIHDQAGTYQSVWQNISDDATGVNGLEIIYLNNELIELGDCAFRDCKSLRKIYFTGDNVETIGQYAFFNCYKLDEFIMPNKVTTISNNCFEGAFDETKNVSLNLGNVTKIEDNAFANSNVYKIEMDNVTYIGSKAFGACYSLTDFIINTQSVVTSNATNDIRTGIFYSTNIAVDYTRKLKIHVPDNLYDSYMSYVYWSIYEKAFVREVVAQ